jgi:phosphoribosylglycinamide formyltransferase-1
MYRVAIFASGSGTNAEKIIQHFKNHRKIKVAVLLSNKVDAFALTRAKNLQVQTKVFSKTEFQDGSVAETLSELGITHVVLAGFLWLIPDNLTHKFPERIINIHPALLPAFGGKGMYGPRVHLAVKASGIAETGITIHLVNEQYDEGCILFQAKCGISATDTPESIAEKVHALEYRYYPEIIEKWILQQIIKPIRL